MASVGESLTDWVDRDAMCRICLCPNPVAKWNLFECTIVGRSIAEILSEVTGISVRRGDNYPTVCCSGCMKQVEVAQRLREQCQESDRRLAKIFEQLEGMVLDKGVKQETVAIEEVPEDEPMEESFTGNDETRRLQIAAIHGLMQPEETVPVGLDRPHNTVISNFQVDGMEIRIEVPGLENILLQSAVPEPPPSVPEVIPAESSAPPQAIECCGCPLTFPTEEKFEAHVKEVHEPNRTQPPANRKNEYECFRCYQLVKVPKNHHMRGNFCKICSKYVVDSGHYQNLHSSYYNPPTEPRIECCGCSRVFRSEESFKLHVENVHKPSRSCQLKPGQTQCFRCYKTFKYVKLRDHHIPYLYCKICSRQFSDRRAANVHYNQKHKPTGGEEVQLESKICCGCGAEFRLIGDLKIHSNQVHYQHRPKFNPERPFQCEICFENYRNYVELHEHQTRYQKNNKPHKCAHCDRSFFFLNSLRDHEKSHTGAS